MGRTGERIKKLRTERGLSMQELADRVGVAKSTVFRWENGETPLDVAGNAHVAKLASVLGTSVPYLRDQIDDPDIVLQNGSSVVMIERKQQPKTENSDRLLLYALDILAMQNGFRIDYTEDGDVILVKGTRTKQIREEDLAAASSDLSRLAGFTFSRLMGGDS